MGIYTKILKPIAFAQDPEKVHNKAIKIGNKLGKSPTGKALIKSLYHYENPKLEQNILGINFKNPVGLSAGFDKNAHLTDILPSIGFGFMEVGSITGQPCEGNPKPRLWRLPKDNSIAVYYGLANEGAEAISAKLKDKTFKIPLAASIAKTNNPKIKGNASINDYYKGFSLMKNIANFMVINISCPNTGDGCTFENSQMLDKLLKKINNKNKKVFLKISSTLSTKQVDKILGVAKKYNLHGFVIGNLNKERKNLKSSKEELEKIQGGLSGEPIRKASNKLIKYLYKKTKGKYVIIGVGGIFSAEDAYEKIKLGASLVQLITGMIYKGPALIKEINKGLVQLLEKDGYKNISEAIGKGL